MSGGGTIALGANTLTIPSGTYSGVIRGIGGGITKSSGGTLTLSGTSTYSGATLISGGVLNLAGALIGSSDVMITGGASLSGNGTVDGALNSGSITPGASIGTIVILGTFVQTADGTYEVEIEPGGDSDFLDIGGTATLAGTLALTPLPGIYTAGTTYLVLEADDGVTGLFDQSIERYPLEFTVSYSGTQVLVGIDSTSAVFLTDIMTLKGNAKAIFDYVYCDDSSVLPHSADFRTVTLALTALAPAALNKALIHMTPQQFRGLALTNEQNSMRMANAMLTHLNSYDYEFVQRCYQREGSALPHDVWVQPLGYTYDQSRREGQFGFDTRTLGVNAGTSLVFREHLVVAFGFNYLHSDLDWEERGGKADIDTIAFTPTVGYISENCFVNFLLLAGRTFYDVDRKISISAIRRTAHNDHKSWELQEVLTGGFKFEVYDSNFFIQPEATVSYLTIFEAGYQESGAKSLNLSVRNKSSSFFKSRIDLRFIKPIKLNNGCLTPSVWVGWLKYVPTTKGDYTSRLYKLDTCKKNFKVKTMDNSTDQLVIGVDLQDALDENFSFRIAYEAAIGDNATIQEGSARIQWNF